LYSGTAPSSHSPSGSAPSAPSSYGSITVAGIPLNYNGNPNFNNYIYVDPQAILDEKYPKPPEPTVPEPALTITPPEVPSLPSASNAEEPTLLNRVLGVIQVIGGAAQTAVGGVGVVAGIVGSAPTGGTSVVVDGLGGVVAGNGLDNIQAGIRQAISGKPVQTATSSAVESVTGSRLAGEGTNLAIGLVGPGTVAKMATGSGLIKSIKSVADDAVGSIKGIGTKIKNWWKGTPKVQGGCFLAGTLISRYRSDTIDQRELIGIENIKSDDLVWACNPRIGTWEPKLVIGISTHLYEGDIIKLIVDGEVIEATGTHPVWIVAGNDLENRTECTNLTNSDSKLTPQGRWVNARDIQVGDTILGRRQKTITISSVESRTETVRVYNFIVDDLHSYAVGNSEMLVHNQSMMPPFEGFKNAADAIGDIHGYAKIVGKAKTKNDKYIEMGFTEIRYIKDSNGVQHTVPYNPKLKTYWYSHESGGW
jgi:hypothetical protein